MYLSVSQLAKPFDEFCVLKKNVANFQKKDVHFLTKSFFSSFKASFPFSCYQGKLLQGELLLRQVETRQVVIKASCYKASCYKSKL